MTVKNIFYHLVKICQMIITHFTDFLNCSLLNFGGGSYQMKKVLMPTITFANSFPCNTTGVGSFSLQLELFMTESSALCFWLLSCPGGLELTTWRKSWGVLLFPSLLKPNSKLSESGASLLLLQLQTCLHFLSQDNQG